MKKIISLVLVLVLALTAIGGTLAYFTDTDEAENVFTVGDVDIMLREYGVLDGSGYSDDDYREELAKQEAMPGITTDKDVWIENVDTSDAYVRVIMSVDKDLTPNWAEGFNTYWDMTEKDYGDHMVYVFQSKEAVAGATIEDGVKTITKTPSIMDSFTMNKEIDEVSIDESYNIPINVYAIQKAGFETADAAYTQLDAEFPDAMPVLVKTTEELIAAIAEVEANAEEGTEISLADGTYTFPSSQTVVNVQNKEITFRGSENAIIDATGVGHITQMFSGATMTFDGVTMNWGQDNEGYQGFANGPKKIIYKNATITGTQFMYSDADFINCVFENEDTAENAYCVYGRGNGTLTFTDCVMYTEGRAIMLFSEHSPVIKVILNNCSFYDAGGYTSKPKAVVETGAPAGNFDIAINNCTTYGFEENVSTNNLWGNKDSIDTNGLNVVIDGVDVY